MFLRLPVKYLTFSTGLETKMKVISLYTDLYYVPTFVKYFLAHCPLSIVSKYTCMWSCYTLYYICAEFIVFNDRHLALRFQIGRFYFIIHLLAIRIEVDISINELEPLSIHSTFSPFFAGNWELWLINT